MSSSSFCEPGIRELLPAARTIPPTGRSAAASRSKGGRVDRIHSTSMPARIATSAKLRRRVPSPSTRRSLRPINGDRSGTSSGRPTTATERQSLRAATCWSPASRSLPRTTMECGPSGSRYVRPRTGRSMSPMTKTTSRAWQTGPGLLSVEVPILGAHVDSSGGLHLAYERAAAMGAEAIQVHPTPPGFWGSPKLDETRIATFKEAAQKHGGPPFYFHAVYLINLAGDDTTLRQRSESTLTGYLKAADELGIDGVIFHTGSHKGAGFDVRLPSILEHIRKVLERAAPKSARLLIENNAGLGGCVGARFEEIARMLEGLHDPRVGVCFATCHAFASGYDERTPADVRKTVDELDRVIGLKNVDVIHCNDSVTGLGSNRDRHANIGEGQIGDEGFRTLLHEPRLVRLPFILEVPGAGDGPDAAQVATLRRLATG